MNERQQGCGSGGGNGLNFSFQESHSVGHCLRDSGAQESKEADGMSEKREKELLRATGSRKHYGSGGGKRFGLRRTNAMFVLIVKVERPVGCHDITALSYWNILTQAGLCHPSYCSEDAPKTGKSHTVTARPIRIVADSIFDRCSVSTPF